MERWDRCWDEGWRGRSCTLEKLNSFEARFSQLSLCEGFHFLQQLEHVAVCCQTRVQPQVPRYTKTIVGAVGCWLACGSKTRSSYFEYSGNRPETPNWADRDANVDGIASRDRLTKTRQKAVKHTAPYYDMTWNAGCSSTCFVCAVKYARLHCIYYILTRKYLST